MDTDDLKQTWQAPTSQTRPTFDVERLVKEVHQKQKSFDSTIFWRDVREVGVSLLMVPVWLYMGITLSLPWAWYLVIPALLWIAGFMLVDRRRHGRRPVGAGEPLRQYVISSLEQVKHQIWLLRNIVWWYLLPLFFPMIAFFGHTAWLRQAGGWETALTGLMMVAVVVGVFAFVYWLNQYAVNAALEPRRWELEALLRELEEEPTVEGGAIQPT